MAKILTENQLDNLFEKLLDDAILANNYFELLNEINNSVSEYQREFSQSNTFWRLTTSALYEAMLVNLCRIYIGKDDNQNLTLYRLLKDISENKPYFAKTNFYERLKSNSFVETLTAVNRMPSDEDIEEDMNLVCEKNSESVKKLKIWRHNVFMHTSRSVVIGNKRVLEDNPIPPDEVKILINQAIDILNKYTSLFKASTYSKQIVDHDDFLRTLKFVKTALKAADQERDQAIQRYKSSLQG